VVGHDTSSLNHNALTVNQWREKANGARKQTAHTCGYQITLEQIGKALFTPLAGHANFSSRTADPIAPGGRAIDLSTLLHFLSRKTSKEI
jgi:hypothetical protein